MVYSIIGAMLGTLLAEAILYFVVVIIKLKKATKK